MPHLRVGTSPEVLKHLANPEVIAVAWRNAWARDNVQLAQRFAALPENNVDGDEGIILPLHRKADLLLTPSFTAEYSTLKSAFLDATKHFKLTDLQDLSRVEPAFGDRAIREGEQFHHDRGIMTGLSNLSPHTTEILVSRPAGRLLDGRFVADGLKIDLRFIRKVTPGTFLVFKGANHPHLAGREMDGLFHRRQAPLPGERTTAGRVVMHLKIG